MNNMMLPRWRSEKLTLGILTQHSDIQCDTILYVRSKVRLASYCRHVRVF